jgi:hypothetical protein
VPETHARHWLPETIPTPVSYVPIAQGVQASAARAVL